jgi:uncharacterized protein (TIRG00374 family)
VNRIKLLIGVVLLTAPLLFLDWRELLRVVLEADASWILAATLGLVLNMPLSSVKWGLLLRAHGIAVGQLALLRAYWIGAFASNYLPSSIGGDVVRAVVIRTQGGLAEVASSILVERLTGLAVLILLSAGALAARPEPFRALGLLLPLWLLVLAAAGVVLGVAAGGRPSARLLDRLADAGQRTVRRLAVKLLKLVSATNGYRQAWRLVLAAMLTSLPFYGILILFQYGLLKAVGASVSFAEVACIAPLVPLIALIPVSINGLGLTEGAFTLFFMQIGVPAETAFAAALLRRAISVLVSLVGGLFWLLEPRQPGPRGSRVTPIPSPVGPGSAGTSAQAGIGTTAGRRAPACKRHQQGGVGGARRKPGSPALARGPLQGRAAPPLGHPVDR